MNIPFEQLQCGACQDTNLVSWRVGGIVLCQACAELATTNHGLLDAKVAEALVAAIRSVMPPKPAEVGP